MAPPNDSEPVTLNAMYFNGFQLALSNADVNALVILNGTPQLNLSMSYTTAKTLAVALNDLINTLEKVTGREIMTTRDVGNGLDKLKAEEPENASTH
jgi:hypothetical protein